MQKKQAEVDNAKLLVMNINYDVINDIDKTNNDMDTVGKNDNDSDNEH